MPDQTLAQRLIDLKQQKETSLRLRAEAEGGLELARKRFDQVTARLKELGVDPENADQELAAAQLQLDKNIQELQEKLKLEIASYNAINESVRSALGG